MHKTLTLDEVAKAIGADLRGDGQSTVTRLCSLADATANDLTFLSSKSYKSYLGSTEACAVILTEEFAEDYSGNALIVDDPYLAYAKISALFSTKPAPSNSIHPSAVIADSAVIGNNVSVGANSVIEDNVIIGDGCEIYPGVVISANSKLGNHCIIYANVSIYHDIIVGNYVTIHSNSVIGADGFGFAPSSNGWVKIHQNGRVIIGDHVEIGASTTIDRGAISDTLVKDGAIIDNQVQVAHNVEVGENTAIAGCAGIAGSTKIGKNCTLGGAVGMSGHLNIVDNSHFLGGTVVTSGTKKPGVYGSNTPMQEAPKWRKCSVRYRQLDDVVNRLKRLEKLQQT
ncbi:UDP-3-O-(3-hydroxymyristoyl)glucosamine N-acyltransferase [Agarilytica rhodophyticola]|uniref:UDP-3-O-(3-hydroxymyristoyl)glucosamine N-acyltransferase n=1 Tax=Agarilytica rhodophyticola TaxID=1737490 RepID=UPI001FEBD6DA|nr:UDP-3-O-(3-hydroxymyristoyl)glucosamine N-acyltransferase [Agarilytica rhodophyticola]